MKNFVRKLLLGVALVFGVGILEIWSMEGVSFVDALFSTLTLFINGYPGSLNLEQL